MHFGKTYTQLLLGLPSELRAGPDGAVTGIEYGALKKLIRRIVGELDALGLGPEELEGVEIEQYHSVPVLSTTTQTEDSGEVDDHVSLDHQIEPDELRTYIKDTKVNGGAVKISYELCTLPDKTVAPRLRVWITQAASTSTTPPYTQELLLPLSSDSAFYNLLATELASLSVLLDNFETNFMANLEDLSHSISNTALPSSSQKALIHRSKSRGSDLTPWRLLFALYADAQIFESIVERDAGQRNIEDSETRLNIFWDRVRKEGLPDLMKSSESRVALQGFQQLNQGILNVRKLQYANAEAFRKILKKHHKRTLLPSPSSSDPSTSLNLALVPLAPPAPTLPRTLLQALTGHLLPLLPSLTDYSCPICTSLAYVPIRLSCAHVFCVRCLVKLQRSGKENCPVCRFPSVIAANSRNVDTARMNLMHAYFPAEVREKQKENKREVEGEMARDLGWRVPDGAGESTSTPSGGDSRDQDACLVQ